MHSDRFADRREKLLGKLRQTDAEALLVSNVTNVSYLTGFRGDSSFLLMGPAQTLLISDGRYTTQIQEECPGLDAHIRPLKQTMLEAVGEAVKSAKFRRLGIESGTVTVEQFEGLTEQVKPLQLVPLLGLVEDLRMVKDREEVVAIRTAIRQAERGFAMLKAGLVAEMTELEAAHELEHMMRRFGAAGAAFEPIVAAGPRAGLPHARPTKTPVLDADLLLVDWGASDTSGYKSDLTRVLITGKISPKLEKIYRVVLRAQRQGIAAIRPGRQAEEVDTAARRVIEEAGYGEQFGHGLGHGFGLEIHEEPRMRQGSQHVLKAGMVVTVEPGIYLPGWGGVRIEDDVLVTQDAAEMLTSVPKEFEEVRLSLEES